MTTESKNAAQQPEAVCRWCGEPIVPSGSTQDARWFHRTVEGTSWCADRKHTAAPQPPAPTQQQPEAVCLWGTPHFIEIDAVKFQFYVRRDEEVGAWVFWIPALGRFTQATELTEAPVCSLVRQVCLIDSHLPPEPAPQPPAHSDKPQVVPCCGRTDSPHICPTDCAPQDGLLERDVRDFFRRLPDVGIPQHGTDCGDGVVDGTCERCRAELVTAAFAAAHARAERRKVLNELYAKALTIRRCANLAGLHREAAGVDKLAAEIARLLAAEPAAEKDGDK